MTPRITIVLALVAVVGCKPKIDADRVESEIEKMLAARGITAGAICPKNLEAKRGATFQCTAADNAGQQMVIDVGIHADEGRAAIKLAGTIVDTAALLAMVKESAGDPNATLACPAKMLVITDTRPAYCDVTTGGETIPIEVVETERAKHLFSWKPRGGPRASAGKAKALVESMLAEHGITVAATCPPNVVTKVGTRFQCTAKVADTGQALTIDVEVEDESGKVNAKLAGTIIDTATYLPKIKAELDAPGATITCPSEKLVITAAAPANCEITDGKTTRKLQIVEVDPAQHLVNWRMADANGTFPPLAGSGSATP